MSRRASTLAAVLFVVPVVLMFALSGEYGYAYIACGAIMSAFMLARIRILAQATGLGLTLLFSVSAQPTLLILVLCISFVATYTYGGGFLGSVPWLGAVHSFTESKAEKRMLPSIAEFLVVAVSAVLLTILASVMSSTLGVRTNGLLAFIFTVSAALLVLALVYTHLSKY